MDTLPYLNNEVGVHAYHADLVVIARPQPAAQTARPPGLAESLILTSGRPIIVFPSRSAVSRVRRVLVGWNARRESIRAAFFCPRLPPSVPIFLSWAPMATPS